MGFWKKPLDVMQTVLDVMGMIPVVGSVADGTNAAISLARGKYEEAALSTLAMIPIVGDAAGAAKIGKNLSKISDLPKQLEQNIYRKTTTGASRKLLTPEQINELRQREIRKLEFEASKRCLRNTCFPSGTLVHTKDGKIPIEQIEAGMMVYAQNIETGETGYQEVLSVSQTSVRKLFHIYLGDIEIQSTAMHRMYVYEKGFVTAQDLLVGDQLVYMADGKQKQIPIDNITVQFYKIPVTVHNFKVDKWHTYMVGQLGILVHNGERTCTPKKGDKGESGNKRKSNSKNKPIQEHHYATNKSKKYTPQIKKITDKYNLNLNKKWNKEFLPHQGRHPNVYHDYVLDKLATYDRIAKGNKEKFLKLFENFKKEVRENPEMLYKDYWRKK